MNRSALAAILLAGCSTTRVLTWNILYENEDHAGTIAAIRRIDADIVCLQEVTPGFEEAARRELAGSYRGMVFHAAQGGSGYAILSKAPFDESGEIPHPEKSLPAGWARIGGVTVLCVHLTSPPVLAGSVRERADSYLSTARERDREIRHFMAAVAADIVAGDFNSLESEAAIAFMRQTHRDALQSGWTWSTAGLRARIDYVFATDAFAPVAARVLESGRSDHRPVVVELRRR